MTLVTNAAFTVADYVAKARVLLQDTKDTPYRYSDADLVVALNIGIGEMWRLRRDLFLGQSGPPLFDGTTNSTDVVPVDAMYRFALILFMCGHAQLRDDEEVQDQRAAAFMGMFQAKLTTVA
jgi:hypothetical protein